MIGDLYSMPCVRGLLLALAFGAVLAGCAGGSGGRAERCGGTDGEWAAWRGFLQSEGKMRVIGLASADVPPFVTEFNEAYNTAFRAEKVYFAFKPHDQTWLLTFVTGPCVHMSARIPSGEARRLMGVSESAI